MTVTVRTKPTSLDQKRKWLIEQVEETDEIKRQLKEKRDLFSDAKTCAMIAKRIEAYTEKRKALTRQLHRIKKMIASRNKEKSGR